MELEEEENVELRKQVARLEKLKSSVEKEIESLRSGGEEMEKDMAGLRKQIHELQADLKTEKEKNESLTSNLEETEESLEKLHKEKSVVQEKLNENIRDNEDMKGKIKEKQKRIRDLETSLGEVTTQRDNSANRLKYFESETKNLRSMLKDQSEEMGSMQVEIKRSTRERENFKRTCDSTVKDFEMHKLRCADTMRQLREEILDLQNKMVEKDRLAMKAKERYQDQIQATEDDLKLIRKMFDGEIRKDIRAPSKIVSKLATTKLSNKIDQFDIDCLKNIHEKYRDEFHKHVDNLEDILRVSMQQTDTITVVQSPMSKIKLEEIKQLRDEIFELNTELSSIRNKSSNIYAELTNLRLASSRSRLNSSSDGELTVDQIFKTEKLERDLKNLEDVIGKIEHRHHAVMTKNARLLQKTLAEDENTSKDLVNKFQAVSLEGENRQLKILLGILKKRYNFSESDLAMDLQMALQNGSQDDNFSLQIIPSPTPSPSNKLANSKPIPSAAAQGTKQDIRNSASSEPVRTAVVEPIRAIPNNDSRPSSQNANRRPPPKLNTGSFHGSTSWLDQMENSSSTDEDLRKPLVDIPIRQRMQNRRQELDTGKNDDRQARRGSTSSKVSKPTRL